MSHGLDFETLGHLGIFGEFRVNSLEIRNSIYSDLIWDILYFLKRSPGVLSF